MVITTKDGLLYADGKLLQTSQADQVARMYDYSCAEQVVKALKENPLALARMIKNPLTGNNEPIRSVLRSLAGQDGCDGVPYDQMQAAADYIEILEAVLKAI